MTVYFLIYLLFFFNLFSPTLSNPLGKSCIPEFPVTEALLRSLHKNVPSDALAEVLLG